MTTNEVVNFYSAGVVTHDRGLAPGFKFPPKLHSKNLFAITNTGKNLGI
jgi:hypothetical protein